jgi:H+/Cl- antiporter ClcA
MWADLLEDRRRERNGGSRSGSSPSGSWGTLSWARWLPEVGNAAIVAMALLSACASLWSYSDEEIRQSLVDTYEPSAWNFLAACIFAVIGVACALLARAVSRKAVRRRIAVFQIVLMVASIGLAAYGHQRLMRRTTELTGRTFGGFP